MLLRAILKMNADPTQWEFCCIVPESRPGHIGVGNSC